MSADVHAEMHAAGLASNIMHFRHLRALGVPLKAVAELRQHHWGWGVVRAVDGEAGLYLPGDGPLHLVLPVYEDGHLIDLVAFRSSEPGNWKLRTGLGLALGLERGWEPHRWEPQVELSNTPLDWLRNGTRGLCVVDWDAPELDMISTFPRLVCTDASTAAHMRHALTRQWQLPEISIKETRLAA